MSSTALTTEMVKNGTNGHRHGRREGKSYGLERVPRLDRAARRPHEDLDPAALLPLTEPMFHILLALAEREMHGYGIIIAVEEATNGEIRLRTGTLYTAVRRMVEDGLIEETVRRHHEGDDGRRRYYRLTRFGRAVARAEASRLEALTLLARSRGLLRRGR